MLVVDPAFLIFAAHGVVVGGDDLDEPRRGPLYFNFGVARIERVGGMGDVSKDEAALGIDGVPIARDRASGKRWRQHAINSSHSLSAMQRGAKWESSAGRDIDNPVTGGD